MNKNLKLTLSDNFQLALLEKILLSESNQASSGRVQGDEKVAHCKQTSVNAKA